MKKYLVAFLNWWRLPKRTPNSPTSLPIQPELDEVVLYPVRLRGRITPENYSRYAAGFLSQLPSLLMRAESINASRATAKSVEHTVRCNAQVNHDTFTTQLYGNLDPNLGLFNVQICTTPVAVKSVTLLLHKDVLGDLFHPLSLTPNEKTMRIITGVAEAMGLCYQYIHRSGLDLFVVVYTPRLHPYYLRDHHQMRASYFNELQQERIKYE